jgi:hypothetical protein
VSQPPQYPHNQDNQPPPGGYPPPPQGAYQPPQGAYQPPQGAYPPPPGGGYPPPQGGYQPPPPPPAPKKSKLSGVRIILFVLALAVIGGVAYYALNSRATRNDAGQVDKAGKQTAFDLKAGDCFNNVPGNDQQVESVDAVPCSQPHEAQVLVNVTVTGTSYPGKDEMGKQVEKLCVDKVGAQLEKSPIAAQIDLYYLHPTAESWAQHDRTGTCIAAAKEGQKLTAPVG